MYSSFKRLKFRSSHKSLFVETILTKSNKTKLKNQLGPDNNQEYLLITI